MLQLVVVVCIIALVLLAWVWQNPKCNGKLPPGSMGFPIIGETLEFFTPCSVLEVSPFMKRRIARYGPIFRTSLAGKKVVMMADPESISTILRQEIMPPIQWFTQWSVDLKEPDQFLLSAAFHKNLRTFFMQQLSPESLMTGETVHQIDQITQKHLNLWASHGTIEARQAADMMVIELIAQKIGYDEPNAIEKLSDSVKAFVGSRTWWMPLNIPGTAYHAGLQANKNFSMLIEEIIEKRETSEMNHHNLVDHLVDELKKGEKILDQTLVIKLIFIFIITAFETTSGIIALALKFVADHPKVLAELTKEHEDIIKRRDNKELGMTWQEYKSMDFTQMVIIETIRIANVVPFISRKLRKDIEINRYTIPAGWFLIVDQSNLHLDPRTFDESSSFNPWRWEGKNVHAGSKTFMPFGKGAGFCVGANSGKLHVAIFLHHLVTKYRWSIVKGNDDIIRNPLLKFPKELHVEISKKYK